MTSCDCHLLPCMHFGPCNLTSTGQHAILPMEIDEITVIIIFYFLTQSQTGILFLNKLAFAFSKGSLAFPNSLNSIEDIYWWLLQ